MGWETTTPTAGMELPAESRQPASRQSQSFVAMRMTGKTATFANESDQVLMPATLALHAHEPMLQSSTAKIRLKLIANEPGD
jgi:hypothetical protein